MPETNLLASEDLRRILKRAASKEATWQEIDLVKDHCAALTEHVRELEVRIDGLEDVASDVRHLVEDVAKHGRQADAPFTTQERAVKLLAIIDGGKDAQGPGPDALDMAIQRLAEALPNNDLLTAVQVCEMAIERIRALEEKLAEAPANYENGDAFEKDIHA